MAQLAAAANIGGPSDSDESLVSSAVLLAINNRIYNVAPLLATHPGGSSVLLAQRGRDATATFLRNHAAGGSAAARLSRYYAGDVAPEVYGGGGA